MASTKHFYRSIMGAASALLLALVLFLSQVADGSTQGIALSSLAAGIALFNLLLARRVPVLSVSPETLVYRGKIWRRRREFRFSDLVSCKVAARYLMIERKEGGALNLSLKPLSRSVLELARSALYEAAAAAGIKAPRVREAVGRWHSPDPTKANWNPPPPPVDQPPSKSKRVILRRATIIFVSVLGFLGLLFLSVMECGFKQAKRIKAAEAEARAFSASADEASCLAEAAVRLESCRALFCETSQTFFLGECLRRCQPTPGFCTGVPSPQPTADRFAWANTRCATVKAGAGPCAVLFFVVQEHCHQASRAE